MLDGGRFMPNPHLVLLPSLHVRTAKKKVQPKIDIESLERAFI